QAPAPARSSTAENISSRIYRRDYSVRRRDECAVRARGFDRLKTRTPFANRAGSSPALRSPTPPALSPETARFRSAVPRPAHARQTIHKAAAPDPAPPPHRTTDVSRAERLHKG